MAKFDKIKAGQSVAFTINNGGVENEGFGTLHNINKDKTRILLKDVIFTKSKKKFSGIMQFYADEIQSIEIICDVHDENETFSNTLEQNPTESDGIDQMLRKLDFVGDEDDVIHILKQWNVYIIEKVGEQCDIALKDIFENEFVALSSAMNDAKHVILILCTRRKTYAFNIGSIGAVPDRLKELLESDAHTKVVYDKSLLPGGIKLTRIFDTSVVHKLNNIALPSKLLQKLNKESTNELDTFISRTKALLEFHDFLTEQLLKNAYQSFESNLNYCRTKDSIQVQLILRNEKSILQRVNEIPPYKLNIANTVDK